MSKFLDLLKGEFIIPIEEIEKDFKMDIPPYAVDGGHACMVSCKWHTDQDEVISFVERTARMSGWIVKIGFPKFEKGRFVWVLLKK